MIACVSLEIGRWHRRNCAVEQSIAGEEALKKGMEAKTKGFVEQGAEVWAKA